MALVKRIDKIVMERNSVHDPVECTYSIFTGSDGQKYLQIDTYGSKTRKFKGKKSQSFQFNRDSLQSLKEIIEQIL